jgi:hypothetical protein
MSFGSELVVPPGDLKGRRKTENVRYSRNREYPLAGNFSKVQDWAPEHRLFALTDFRCGGNLSRTKRLGMGYLKMKFNCRANLFKTKRGSQVIRIAKLQMPSQFVPDKAPGHKLFALDKHQMPSQFV